MATIIIPERCEQIVLLFGSGSCIGLSIFCAAVGVWNLLQRSDFQGIVYFLICVLFEALFLAGFVAFVTGELRLRCPK